MAYTTASSGKGEIAGRFAEDDAARTQILEIARLCAALTKPWVLPAENQDPASKLPQSFQSIGSWGVANLTGAMQTAIFPPSVPWFQYALDAKILYNKNVSSERKQALLDDLFLCQLVAQGMLEATHLDDIKSRHKRPRGFWSAKNRSLTQLNITGDTLEQFTDDYRVIVYRRDQYVTKRNSSGDVLYHIVKECVDPLDALDPKQREKAELKDDDLKDNSVKDRIVDLYTRVEWNPAVQKWVIEQEVNGHIINRSEETVSQFLSTPYDLTGGEDYGRGFVEQSLGDLRMLDNLEMRLADFAAMCSTMWPCVDVDCQVDDEDFQRPSGSIQRGFTVRDGRVQNVAFLQVDKFADFKVVHESIARKQASLARAMLIESELTPQKERVTAYQVQRIVAQLQSATGGMQADIADDQQVGLVRRLTYQCRRDKLIPMFPKGAVRIDALTGIAALAKQSKLGSILQFADVAARLGPEIVARLSPGVVLNTIRRYQNIEEPGMVRTEEEMQAETQKQIAAEGQLAAAQKIPDVIGNVAEANLTQQATGG